MPVLQPPRVFSHRCCHCRRGFNSSFMKALQCCEALAGHKQGKGKEGVKCPQSLVGVVVQCSAHNVKSQWTLMKHSVLFPPNFRIWFSRVSFRPGEQTLQQLSGVMACADSGLDS
ncbi:unnamed protein product [Symbiodinium natans]|uniref:Uncharacterized protein n=1 Tax=Symbiodinium natans TaxID=878477 RepID=A0A812JZH4_9DINO|nr:unnamed protein product [Symbiodinium natans]